MTGVVLDRGRKPSLAAGFQKTEIQPQIWLMSFPVCNCARINASVLDPRENQSFVRHITFQLSRHLFQERARLPEYRAEWQFPLVTAKCLNF